MRKRYRVIRRFERFKVGDFVYPIGLVRSSWIKSRRIVLDEENALTPAVEPEPAIEESPVTPDDEPVDDIDEDDSPLVETATITAPIEAVLSPRRGRGRPRRVQ